MELAVTPVPQTLRITVRGRKLEASEFELSGKSLSIVSDSLDSGVAVVRYRPIPVADYSRKALAGLIEVAAGDSVGYYLPVVGQPSSERANDDDVFGNRSLRRSGSISRGVIAGNRQDATIESGLRLQLEGEVVDGVNLKAVLSDENTPILPEGTTQRINEFDKVFIELSGRSGAVQLGDFELNLDATSFGRFNRKLQGVNVSGKLEPGTDGTGPRVRAVTSAATARGIFRSQQIEILEGSQGPYRLVGENGERFIILIPASETVYLDGERLVRGESNDYVVDYSTAEITFTPSRLIGPEHRVYVEFQYTTNQFTRTLLGSEAVAEFGRVAGTRPRASIGVSFIREADSRQFFDEFGLTRSDSLLIAAAGDGTASRSGAEEVAYNPEALFVQYTREIVLTPSNESDTVFVAVSGPVSDSTRVYRVRFSPVPEGTGSYDRVGRSINGIVYEFVGAGNGDYEPIRLLPIPRRQRLLSIAGRAEPLAGVQVYGEVAQSSYDKNRLSSLDAGDDAGRGMVAGLMISPQQFAEVRGVALSVSATAERRSRESTFTTFNRTRSVEFARDWDLGARSVSVTGGVSGVGSETMDLAETGLHAEGIGTARFRYGRLSLGDSFVSYRLSGEVQSSVLADSSANTFRVRAEQVVREDADLGAKGEWVRSSGLVRVRAGQSPVVPQFSFEQENRQERRITVDSLTATSLRFLDLRPGVGFSAGNAEAFAELRYRIQDEVLGGRFIDGSNSVTAAARIRRRSSGNFRTEATVGYRVRNYSRQASSELGLSDQQSVVLGWSGDWRPLQRLVVTSWNYQAQTERTPRLQEIYVRTGPEFGEYVWVDDNQDGVPQIEEFVYETTPNEGVYSRTFVPSDSLFSAVAVQTRLRLDVDPARIVSSRTLFGRVLGALQAGSLIEISEKSRTSDIADIYLLRQKAFRGTNTLNGRILFRQTLAVLRTNRRFGIDAAYTTSSGLSDLSASAEERKNRVGTISTRLRLNDALVLQLEGSIERKLVYSAAFTSRQFDLRTRAVVPSVVWTPASQLSVRFAPEVSVRRDRLADRGADVVKIPIELRIQRARRFQLFGRLETASVALTGQASGLASFELTDGRGAGRSYLWNATGEYLISRYLRASLSYDGRSPASAPTLHTVRMQLSATF